MKFLYKAIVPYNLRIILRESYERFEPKLFLWLGMVLYSLPPKRFLKRLFKRKVVLFYPELPVERYHAIHKICYLLGYRRTNNINKKFDIALSWEDLTVRKVPQELMNALKERPVLNIRCTDISKKHVDEVFKEVFGYSLMIDPLTFVGKGVQKSDDNAKHDGKVIDCPVKEENKGFIYQKLIDNVTDDGQVMDVRVPVFKNNIPFVYYKYRKIDDRFNHYTRADLILDVGKVFSKQEVDTIILFCEKLGLDYGELDILRDRQNGRIYIVDANNTPSGPRVNRMRKKDFLKALELLADNFEEMIG